MRGKPSDIVRTYKESSSGNGRLSRYKNLKRLINEDGVAYIETPEKVVIRESQKDIFYSVELGFENRLDLISYKFYNTPFLWWVIAIMNNIENPLDVQAGIVLRIPSMSTLYEAGGVLS